ncbi:MAG: hypothetical protein LUC22_00540, partial [Prevotella sp.]|nr:hypothetical protein [Prevotella sp.]
MKLLIIFATERNGGRGMEENSKKPVKKDRQNREIIAKYFLDLSKLSFATIVLGSCVPVFTSGAPFNWTFAGIGIAATITLYVIG